MEIKTFTQIRNEVAERRGFASWSKALILVAKESLSITDFLFMETKQFAYTPNKLLKRLVKGRELYVWMFIWNQINTKM